ncbi:hypothetical protein CEXT_612801 [Caerostris extrusa]|uniref:Uncharacterized protein n=1 Tax=Caerostris extrusa TaxID=172846 RepID=A0AAV4QR69_CAEEX|nr:hypothetical protein CEXT_612801 [Caerostris extrusa]
MLVYEVESSTYVRMNPLTIKLRLSFGTRFSQVWGNSGHRDGWMMSTKSTREENEITTTDTISMKKYWFENPAADSNQPPPPPEERPGGFQWG